MKNKDITPNAVNAASRLINKLYTKVSLLNLTGQQHEMLRLEFEEFGNDMIELLIKNRSEEEKNENK